MSIMFACDGCTTMIRGGGTYILTIEQPERYDVDDVEATYCESCISEFEDLLPDQYEYEAPEVDR